MKTTLEFTQTKTVEKDENENVIYRVNNVVNYVENIPAEVFTHNTETEVFSHVASMWDMNHLPASKAAAISADVDYYRTSVAEKSFQSLDTSQRFEAHVYSRVSDLVSLYSAARDDFPGEIRRIVVEQ
jgi:hypothetical protein